MRLGHDLLHDPAVALGREWLVSDGLGGWSAASVCGAHTRREHGLLVARVAPGGPPHVLLARLEETVELDGARVELGTNQYPGVLHPRGFERLASFSVDPLPQWTWDLGGGARLTRTLARPRGRAGLVLGFTLEGPSAGWIELRPLLSGRPAASLRPLPPGAGSRAGAGPVDLVLEADGGPEPTCCRVSEGEWLPDGLRYRDLELEREREAGRDFREDLLSPGRLRCPLRPGRPLHLLAWAGPIPPLADARELLDEERRRLRALRGGEGLLPELRQLAESFLAEHAREPELVPAPGGPPGPERLLHALPGLLGEPGRHELAVAVLGNGLGRLSAALGAGTADPAQALLWPVAAARWAQSSAGLAALAAWRVPLLRAVAGLAEGRAPGLAPAENGLLLEAGQPAPRLAAQALWFNALLLGAELARSGGDAARASAWSALAARLREVVLRGFWDEARGGLRLDLAEDQARPRPETLLAVSLPHALLPRERAQRLLERLGAELLHPLGLREPAPAGGELLRPAWAGPYFEGLIRVAGEEGKRQARAWLHGYAERTCGQGLVSAPEAWQAAAPHAALGAACDAWSVGELLRLAARLGRRHGH